MIEIIVLINMYKKKNNYLDLFCVGTCVNCLLIIITKGLKIKICFVQIHLFRYLIGT